MFKKTRKLSITSINLNKISFALPYNIPLLKKEDLFILLNERPFHKFDIFYEHKEEKKIYSIIPYKPFKYTDTLYIQILNRCFESYRHKINFSMALDKGCGKTNFLIPGNTQGKYQIKLNKINDIPVNLTSNSFVVSRPIDQSCSCIFSPKRVYKAGEYIELLLYILTIDGIPVPDGLYEIELIESDD
ncbi:hypothetical protein N3C_2911 [Clostridium sp. N3C]|uniref:hypothetical protein n=1 Tax=Clostridium sp. N3C TaxID=1776758 RepID=UPI00092E0576|nr:hypothetical protein [Clostridium sp. N3C]SCN26564.1 hypothetical protein N3C_2911 [Clostridium sp. N3C]